MEDSGQSSISKEFQKEFEDADAFLDSILEEAGLSSPSSVPASATTANTSEQPQSGKDLGTVPATGNVQVFDIDAAGASAPETHFTEAEVQSHIGLSLCDSSLRDCLECFYREHNAENLSHLDSIVQKYRGGNVVELWVQLALKYNIHPAKTVDLLARTIYPGSPQVCSTRDKCTAFIQKVESLSIDGSYGAQDVDFFIQRAIARGDSQEALDLLRAYVSQGVPADSALRPSLWKVFLGYQPITAFQDWGTIADEKRAVYTHYKQEYLRVGADSKLEVRPGVDGSGHSDAGQPLLEEICADVAGIQPGVEYFRLPKAQSTLAAILFIYARLHPAIRYVQGMHEIAAMILYVLRADVGSAEADAFWCFCAFMKEIKGNFLEVDGAAGAVHEAVGTDSSLLSKYDPALAEHLSRCELEPGIFVLRWITLFFARDIALPELLNLWDLLLADSSPLEFCRHVSVALLLDSRERLLGTSNVMELAEIMQAAPRHVSVTALIQKARAFSALERRAQVPAFPPMSAVNVVQHVAGAMFQGFFGKF